jgi:hypothetical protein
MTVGASGVLMHGPLARQKTQQEAEVVGHNAEG